MFEFTGVLKRRNTYGDRYVSSTPTTVRAADRKTADVKALQMVGAEYDSFRKLWSHVFLVTEIREVAE